MAILTKGQTFANADTVTSTKLNNLVDAATFVSGASGTTDDTSLEVNGSGRLQVKDLGISSAKLAASAVTTAKIASATGATDGVTYAKLQHVANMRVIGNVSGSLAAATEVSILDEDDMATDSATAIPTQQSVKAYVDAEVANANILTFATAQTFSGNTEFSFTGIPAAARRIMLYFYGISTSGTSPIIVQIGSGSYTTSLYQGSAAEIKGSPDVSVFTNGFGVSQSPAATDVIFGTMTIVNLYDDYWVASFSGGNTNTNTAFLGGGGLNLSAALDRVRLTTSGGSDTFDAGVVNISYE